MRNGKGKWLNRLKFIKRRLIITNVLVRKKNRSIKKKKCRIEELLAQIKRNQEEANKAMKGINEKSRCK